MDVPDLTSKKTVMLIAHKLSYIHDVIQSAVQAVFTPSKVPRLLEVGLMFRVFAGASVVPIAAFCCSHRFCSWGLNCTSNQHTDSLPNPIQCTARNALHDVRSLRSWLSNSPHPPYVETKATFSRWQEPTDVPCPVLHRTHFTDLRCMLRHQF